VRNRDRIGTEEHEVQRHPIVQRDIDDFVPIGIGAAGDSRLPYDLASVEAEILACDRRPDGRIGGCREYGRDASAFGDRMLDSSIGEEHRSHLRRTDEDSEEDGRGERELHRGCAALLLNDKRAFHHWILNAASAVIGTVPLRLAAELSAIGP
jgi:hypothetical protein